jgi:hypothetical protein
LDPAAVWCRIVPSVAEDHLMPYRLREDQTSGEGWVEMQLVESEDVNG